MTKDQELKDGTRMIIDVANAAISFALDHGPVPAAASGNIESKIKVATLLAGQLEKRGLTIVRKDSKS